MTSRERWNKLEELFNSARELPAEQRESVLGGQSIDPELRLEIEQLLRAHDALEMRGEDAFPVSLDTVRASILLSQPSADYSATAPLAAGDTVGRYRIVRAIGRGGMGVIYLASDPRLNRSVAIKMLPAHLSVDGKARRRFEEEARAASLLDHPHIATVYEVGETGEGQLFIAMAYYEGETLRDKLERGRLPITDVLALAAQIADGLDAAHKAGLVHRDIKPGNIIITRQGVAKIVDFGIARIATDEITHGSAMAGTVAYMSPEQTRGATPDPRMDVWSLGVVLYEMLTGVRPFRGDRDEVVIFAIRNDEPDSIGDLCKDGVPAQLIRIVQRCLRKNPDERYQHAGEIGTDLKKLSYSAADTISARVAPTDKRSWWRSQRYVAAATATFAIAIAGGIWIRNNQIAVAAVAAVPHSVAVLPFDNQGNASNDDHFSAGLADELITALGAIPDLKVAARTSTFALYSARLDASAIAARLGVATVLEGSVRRDSTRLRISARLVQARDNSVLWSRVYDVSTRDVFTVQEQIARSIATALNVRLSSHAADSFLVGRPTASLEAHDLYLRGRYLRTRPTRDRLEQAVGYFRGAIERDPGFADAYSGLAETYVNLANFGYITSTEGFEAADIASERALELNPRLAEAYTSHGYVLTSRREFVSAEAAFRRALDLNPNSALSHHYYSLLLAILDRTNEALEQNRLAREIDPLFTPAVADYGIILCQRGQLNAADIELKKALSLEPKYALTLYWLGAVRAAEGSYSEARQLLERAATASPDYPGVLGSLAYVYTRAGKPAAAESIVATLRARATDDRGRANLAFAYAALGRADSAFVLLRKLQWDVPSVIGLRADPLLKSLRSDSRYTPLTGEITRPDTQFTKSH
jgi:serine/threonine protein kinase/tetratricopeptide (TPR) repeat protein